MEISIIISTLNRPNKIFSLLDRVRNINYKSAEIIVVDQSTNYKTANLLNNFPHSRLKYFRLNSIGLSQSRNYGVRHSNGKIIVFIDDDCLPSLSWLENIHNTFVTFKEIWGVFGRTEPYNHSNHLNQICPCIFQNQKLKVMSEPVLHWKEIGYGNNMAFRKEVFNRVGYFSKALGLGSMGLSAEDAEFALRLLNNGYKLVYNPKVIIFHNRWITKEEIIKLNFSYSCGEVACYGYYSFLGVNLAKKVVAGNFTDSFYKLKKSFKQLNLFNKTSIKAIYLTFKELLYRFRGLLVAILLYMKRLILIKKEYFKMSRIDKIIYKNNCTKDFFFIQIGANDGLKYDPIYKYIVKYNWEGVLVEPIKYIFKKLKFNYKDCHTTLYFENSAIDVKRGHRVMYRLKVNKSSKNPEWYQGLSTFNKQIIYNHKNEIPNYNNLIVKENVRCITFAELIKKYNIMKIDFLVLDTEGYDYNIIKLINFNKTIPKMILYEHSHLLDDDYSKCRELLKGNSYKLITEKYDTLAYIN